MTIYADYTFYTDNYLKGRKAAVQAADFDYFSAEASQTIKALQKRTANCKQRRLIV